MSGACLRVDPKDGITVNVGPCAVAASQQQQKQQQQQGQQRQHQRHHHQDQDYQLQHQLQLHQPPANQRWTVDGAGEFAMEIKSSLVGPNGDALCIDNNESPAPPGTTSRCAMLASDNGIDGPTVVTGTCESDRPPSDQQQVVFDNASGTLTIGRQCVQALRSAAYATSITFPFLSLSFFFCLLLSLCLSFCVSLSLSLSIYPSLALCPFSLIAVFLFDFRFSRMLFSFLRTLFRDMSDSASELICALSFTCAHSH
jgi:hypothetical protein